MSEKYASSTEVTKKMQEKFKITAVEARKELDRTIEVLMLLSCDPNYKGVQFMGKFTMERKYRNPRMGRNPRTKEEIEIPGHYTVTMKPGKEFNKQLEKLPKQD